MMDWLFEPLPRMLALVLSVFILGTVTVLALTRLRGTWFAPLAAANLALVLLWGHVWEVFEPAPWRIQVAVMRLMELPLLTGLAVLCVVQARRLTPSEHRLRWALRVAPTVLVCAWVAAVVGEQVWPRPTLDPFAEMPVKNWILLTVLCVPFQTYIWTLTFLFARSAGPRSPTRRLRAQNFLLAVAVGGYAMSSVNVLVGYAVLALSENPIRREITLIQFLIEERLFLVWSPALLLGLLLAATPAAARAVRAADALAVLPLRERFEGFAWRLEAGGALRRLTRPLYHLRRAADDLGLPEADAAKALQAVKLAAVMGSPRVPADLTRQSAGELLARLEAVRIPGTVPPAPLPSVGERSGSKVTTSAAPDYLPEVLDAALELSASTASMEIAKSPNRPTWFELARVACTDAGISPTDKLENSCDQRAVGAYRQAANLSCEP